MKKTNKITAFFKSLGLFLIMLNLVMLFAVPAYATSISETVKSVGDVTELPSYSEAGHPEASYEEGAAGITTAILYAVDALKYLLGTIAVIIIIASGIQLVVAGKHIDEVATKQKENIKYALIGLIIIIVADTMIQQVFFGEAGEVYRSETEAQMAAERGSEQLRGIYRMMEYFVGALAVFMLIYHGIKLVIGGGSEEVTGKAKKGIAYALVGLILVGVSELVVMDILFPEYGEALPSTQRAQILIVNFTNFVSGFISTLAIAAYMYGGFLYVTAAGREEQSGKAKKVIIGATIGLLLALAAFAIVNTVIRLEPLAEAPVAIPGG